MVGKKKLSVNSKDISKRLKKAEGATIRHARRFVVRRLDSFKDARRHIAMWVILVGVLIGATAIQFLWYQQGYRTTAEARTGTYAEGVTGPLDTLNPLFTATAAEESANELIFSRLMRYDKKGALNYDLAEKVEISKDQKTYTVTIRPDARWHDGLYVRARDVVFTVGLVRNASVQSSVVGWNNVVVKEVDNRTVSFTLPGVYAPFEHALEQLAILPEHILRDIEPSEIRENSFSTKPVGSGPFAVQAVQNVDIASGQKVVHLVRNDDYYRGSPRIDRFQLYVYKDSDSMKRAFSRGEVHAMTGLSVVDAESIDAKKYITSKYAVNTGAYALLNTRSQDLSDVRVRQALQAGTDTDAIRKDLSPDLKKLYLPFIDGQLSGKIPAAPEVSSKKAGELLDKAGWKIQDSVRVKGDKRLSLSVVAMKNNDSEKVLNAIASQWRGLGIEVTTTVVDPSDPLQNVAQEILQPRKFDVLLYPLTIGGDPDVYAYWHSSQASGGYNFSGYRNVVGDEALVSARTRIEPALRNAKYLTFAEQWLRDAPAIGLYQMTTQYVHTKGVSPASDDIRLVSSTDRYADILYWSTGDRRAFKTP